MALRAGLGVFQLPQTPGRPVALLASDEVMWLEIGQTVAWELVAPNNTGAPIVLRDGSVQEIGKKAIEYGTVMVRLSGGTYQGMYAPYLGGAANGQGALEQDYVGLVNRTLHEDNYNVDFVGFIAGGLIWRERLLVGGAGQPTLANLRAVMPQLRLTRPQAG